MRVLRSLLLAVAVAAIVGGVGAVVALNPDFQTWVGRKVLARVAGARSSIGRIEASLGAVDLVDLRIERGGAILTVPFLHAEMPALPALLKHRVVLQKLVGAGWTLDLSRMAHLPSLGMVAAKAPSGARPFSLLPEARAEADPAPADLPTVDIFRTGFARLRLPVDLTLDGADLDGQIILPPPPGGTPTAVRTNILGGGLGDGREGRFVVRLAAAGAPGAAIQSLNFEGELAVAMDSPRTFSQFGLRLNAAAFGPQVPRGVRLIADFGANRGADGESFSAVISGESKPIATVLFTVPLGGGRPAGSWSINVSDDDLTPFALGHVLPAFVVAGEGRFDCDPSGRAVHVVGGLDAAVERLESWRPALAPLGTVRLTGDFDVTRSGSAWRIDRVAAFAQGAQPILSARSLQPFGFDARTAELNVARADRPLFGLSLAGLPAGWLRILMPEFDWSGGPIRGELAASAHQGRLSLATTAPLTDSSVSVGWAGHPVLRNVAVAAAVTADYTVNGWQLAVESVKLMAGERGIAEGEGKLGRREGQGEPLRVEGRVRCDLPSLLGQPALAGWAGGPDGDPTGAPVPASAIRLSAGLLAADFTASLGPASTVRARLACTGLAGRSAASSATWPALTADGEADFVGGSLVKFSLPMAFQNGASRSDLKVDGAWSAGSPEPGWRGQIDADRLNLDDAVPLIAFLANAPGGGFGLRPAGGPPATRGSAVFRLNLRRVDLGTDHGTGLTGLLSLAPGRVALTDASVQLDPGGSLTGGAEIDRIGDTEQAWTLKLGGTLSGFDPAPFVRRLNPDQPAVLEGQFTVTGSAAGRGASLAEAVSALQGECTARSKGGRFRLLSAVIAPKSKGGGALGAILGVADKFGDMFWRHKPDDFADPAEAVIYLGKTISDIPYDQLSLTVARGELLDTEIRDFALISPELRLAGSGVISYERGTALTAQPLKASFTLSARGRSAAALKKVDALDSKVDSLGYQAFTVPLNVRGSLENPDTTDLQAALLKLAAGSGGLLNRIFGK